MATTIEPPEKQQTASLNGVPVNEPGSAAGKGLHGILPERLRKALRSAGQTFQNWRAERETEREPVRPYAPSEPKLEGHGAPEGGIHYNERFKRMFEAVHAHHEGLNPHQIGLFHKQVGQYEKKMEVYHKEMAKYHEKLDKYHKDMEAYLRSHPNKQKKEAFLEAREQDLDERSTYFADKADYRAGMAAFNANKKSYVDHLPDPWRKEYKKGFKSDGKDSDNLINFTRASHLWRENDGADSSRSRDFGGRDFEYA